MAAACVQQRFRAGPTHGALKQPLPREEAAEGFNDVREVLEVPLPAVPAGMPSLTESERHAFSMLLIASKSSRGVPTAHAGSVAYAVILHQAVRLLVKAALGCLFCIPDCQPQECHKGWCPDALSAGRPPGACDEPSGRQASPAPCESEPRLERVR